MRYHHGTVDQRQGTLTGSMANSVLVLLVAVVIVCAVFAMTGLVRDTAQPGCGSAGASATACAEDNAG